MTTPIVTKADVDLKELRQARWVLVGCSAVVFITSVCIMVLELTASRLIAKAVGSSLYTWTSVIGVILAGISIGNFIGGWIADRYHHRRALGWLFFASSFCCITIYPLVQLVGTQGRPNWITWQAWVVFVVAALFLHPSIVLGTISPITAAMALKNTRFTGSTVGTVYAWGAMGSIFGTFLAGFYLISSFGTQHIIWMTAAVLALLGIVVSSGHQMFRGAMLFGWLQFVILVGLLASVRVTPDAAADETDGQNQPGELQPGEAQRDEAASTTPRRPTRWQRWSRWFDQVKEKSHELGLELGLRGDYPDEYNDESDYFYINVVDRHERADTVKALHLDHLTHSYFNPRKPTELYYDYEEVYAAVTERSAESWQRQASIPLQQLPQLNNPLPQWAHYDANSRQLRVTGAMTPGDRETLLSLSQAGEYWKAIEDLTSDANMREVGGLSTAPLEKLPEGLTIPARLERKIRYDTTLGTLIRYEEVSPHERQALLSLGPDQAWRQAIEALYARSRRISTLFLGGGGFVFPRWIENKFPDQPLIHVLELDPAVKRAVQREMGLPADDKTFVKTLIGDARNSVDDLLNGYDFPKKGPGQHHRYDFIYGDAFNDFSVPWHLTTREFNTKIKSLLSDEGVFLVNIIDIYPRAESPRQRPRGRSEITSVAGPLPTAIWPANQRTGVWYPVPDRSQFGDVSLLQTDAGQFQIKCTTPLSEDAYSAWTELINDHPVDASAADAPAADVPTVASAVTGSPNVAAPGPATAATAARGKYTLAQAIDLMYDESNRLPVYAGELPSDLQPERTPEGEWVLARPPYDYLEIKQVDPPLDVTLPTAKSQCYVLGLRGVADPQKEQKLLQLAGQNRKLQEVFRDLARQSREQKTGRFLGAYVNTVSQVFPHVYVFSANKGLPTEARDTFVVACALKKLNLDNLQQSGGYWNTPPFAWREQAADKTFIQSTQMDSILELARGVTLTDDYAPVDNLLIPVFADQ